MAELHVSSIISNVATIIGGATKGSSVLWDFISNLKYVPERIDTTASSRRNSRTTL